MRNIKAVLCTLVVAMSMLHSSPGSAQNVVDQNTETGTAAAVPSVPASAATGFILSEPSREPTATLNPDQILNLCITAIEIGETSLSLSDCIASLDVDEP